MARVITLSGEITEKLVKDVIQEMQNYILDDDKSEKERKDFTRDPIHLMINSFGGDAYSGVGLGTMIKSSKTPIYTYCVGAAMSSGFWIFLGGCKRYCYEGSTFLYHQISHGCYDKLNNLQRLIEQDKIFQDRADKFVMENTKITKTQIKNINEKNHDWFITPEEALELGIIDEIL